MAVDRLKKTTLAPESIQAALHGPIVAPCVDGIAAAEKALTALVRQLEANRDALEARIGELPGDPALAALDRKLVDDLVTRAAEAHALGHSIATRTTLTGGGIAATVLIDAIWMQGWKAAAGVLSRIAIRVAPRIAA